MTRQADDALGLGPAGPSARFNVLGTAVDALSLDQARDLLLTARGEKRLGYVCATGVHGVSEARRDPTFRAILNRAWMNVPDGMPLVWLGRWHGHHDITRVYGPDLMLEVCDHGRAVGLTHYFCGGAPGVAQDLAATLSARLSGLQVVGTFTPPFRALAAAELAELRADVAACQPDVVWLALGTPKQERFAAETADLLEAGIVVTVGAAFDFHTGRLPQAPPWMQRTGLEWFFRLCAEPRRLWKRYLRNNPTFIARTFAQLTGLRRYPTSLPPPGAQ